MVNVKPGTITISDTSQFSKDISALYLNDRFSDVILIVDGTELHAHGVILSARSDYFASLLYDDKQNLKQNKVVVSDSSLESFRYLLKYIYTGTVTIPVSIMTDVLAWAGKLSLKKIGIILAQKIKSYLDINNVCTVLNIANLYNLDEIRDACYSFLDLHASEILGNNCFNDLSQVSLINLLERDIFHAPEIEIFKSVAKWCQDNDCDSEFIVLQCVRLSLLSVVEIVSVVWPSKLVSNEELLEAIAEIVDVKPKTKLSRAKRIMDENLATPEKKTEFITGEKRDWLLTGNRNVDLYCSTAVNDKDGFTIKFGFPAIFNYIETMLWDKDNRYYCYYVEVSTDGKNWKKVIDYSKYSCRSVQKLFFEPTIAKFVRVVGTHNTANEWFHLIYFEAYLKSTVPKIINGIICPTTNVATIREKAIVIEGSQPENLLNGITTDYGKYTYHQIGKGHITVQLAQPYNISSVKLLLWDNDSRFYKYYVETSINNKNWTMVADKRNEECKSWQVIHFTEMPVVYIRITGTHNSKDPFFHLMHFECPAGKD